MKLTTILLIALIPLNAQTQNNYTEAIQQGDAALGEGKYKIAIKKYHAAEAFDPSKKDFVQGKVESVLDAVEALRKKEERAKEQLKSEKEKTQKTLDALKATSDKAVSLLLIEIDRNILHLEYDSTFDKCQTAIDLKAQPEAVKKKIWEIAYFFTEADKPAAALPFLNLLGPTRISANSSDLQAKLRTYLAKTVPATYLAFLEHRYYPKLVLVEGGGFVRVQNKQEFMISVSDFAIAETETTFWQYAVFALAEKHEMQPPSWQFAGNNPAVNINWYDAAAYLNWLSKRHGKQAVYALRISNEAAEYSVNIDDTAKGYRLPTEAEWEFAARGGTRTQGYTYSGNATLDNVGWFDANADRRTQAIGRKFANELEIFDMSGNAWEWCRDWYESYNPENMENPMGPGSGDYRVMRGGGFNSNDAFCKSDHRTPVSPDKRDMSYGFRVAGPAN